MTTIRHLFRPDAIWKILARGWAAGSCVAPSGGFFVYWASTVRSKRGLSCIVPPMEPVSIQSSESSLIRLEQFFIRQKSKQWATV